MARFGGAAVGGSRSDPLSGDRTELLDLDELMKKVHDKRKENGLLEQQVLQLEHYIGTVVDALRCTDAEQLDELMQQLTPHPSVIEEQLVSTQHCESLNLWATADDCVALHKMLGTELVTTGKGKIIGKVHCHEDNYPHLPPKLIVIQELPNSNMFKMRATEILLYIECTQELTNLMLRSPVEEMVKCFQETQSQIFDSVDRDNIFQNLNTKKLIKQTLTCNMSRSGIYFMLPRLKHAFRTSIGKSAGGGFRAFSSQVGEFNSVTSIVQNYFSVQLFVESNKESGWFVNVTCDDDVELESVPAHLNDAMTEFALEVRQGSVTDAVSKLLRKMEQAQDIIDDDGDSTNDELGALF